MARRLLPLNIPFPGRYGLNKQEQDGVLEMGWATEATNLIYNERGRLACRKGTQNRLTADLSDLTTVHEYIDASADTAIIYASDVQLSKEDGSNGTASIIGSATAREYKFVNFNGWCVGHHPDYVPIEVTTVGGTFAAAGGTQYNGKDVLAAFGRLWIIVGNDLYYSDLLINSFAGGSSGSFDLASYWPNGMDESVAIAEWNDFLVVFGKRSILIYENPDDPTTSMALNEIITGVGCIARDSVQSIGNDLLFLSNSGVRSLGRTIQEKSLPYRDVSKNVRDYIYSLAYTTSGTLTRIKSLYSESNRFYLISFFDAEKVLCFDMAQSMEDGSYRCTEWDMQVSDMKVFSDETVVLLLSADGTTCASNDYTGYLDDVDYQGAGGDSYDILYEGPWNDFGEEIGQNIKSLKSINTLIGGTNGDQVDVKWAVDYLDSFEEETITFPSENEFTAGIRVPMTKSGQVVKIGLESTIYGTEKTLKRFNIMAKLGRYV